MPIGNHPVLDVIEAFLERSGMTPTAFGHKALNDPTLVHELRKGRDCRRTTVEKITDFIESETARSEAA